MPGSLTKMSCCQVCVSGGALMTLHLVPSVRSAFPRPRPPVPISGWGGWFGGESWSHNTLCNRGKSSSELAEVNVDVLCLRWTSASLPLKSPSDVVSARRCWWQRGADHKHASRGENRNIQMEVETHIQSETMFQCKYDIYYRGTKYATGEQGNQRNKTRKTTPAQPNNAIRWHWVAPITCLVFLTEVMFCVGMHAHGLLTDPLASVQRTKNTNKIHLL